MEVADILKIKPINTRLYSPAFGYVHLKDSNGGLISVLSPDNKFEVFFNDGKYTLQGEVMLYPSDKMRDWSKFAWQKGDVLVSNDGSTEVIFNNWYDDNYINFYGKHYLNSEDKNDIKYKDQFLCITNKYSFENNEAAQTYINTIEERLCGKLNMETLEIEPAKPKWTPKPFDKVLVRDTFSDTWRAAYFSHFTENGRYATTGLIWNKCIPYNEETAHLIGTTNDWEG